MELTSLYPPPCISLTEILLVLGLVAGVGAAAVICYKNGILLRHIQNQSDTINGKDTQITQLNSDKSRLRGVISISAEEKRSLKRRVRAANKAKEKEQEEEGHFKARVARYRGEVKRLKSLIADLRTEFDVADKKKGNMQGKILTLRQQIATIENEAKEFNIDAKINLNHKSEAERKLEISENKLNILKERLRAAGLDDEI